MEAVAVQTETKKWDLLGIALSMLCAIHCLSLPLLIGVLPLIGLDFLANHEFEWVMMGIIFLVAGLTYWNGYRRHKRVEIFAYLAVGVLVFSMLRPMLPEEWHSLATLAGGAAFILGHWKNWHWHRENCSKACCSNGGH